MPALSIKFDIYWLLLLLLLLLMMMMILTSKYKVEGEEKMGDGYWRRVNRNKKSTTRKKEGE